MLPTSKQLRHRGRVQEQTSQLQRGQFGSTIARSRTEGASSSSIAVGLGYRSPLQIYPVIVKVRRGQGSKENYVKLQLQKKNLLVGFVW